MFTCSNQKMLLLLFFTLLTVSRLTNGLSWNNSDGILPWESYLKVGDMQRPLGLQLNRSSIAHHHFAIGYLCLQSFMYDEAQDAFELAIDIAPTFVEPYIGKMLGCKHPLWGHTDFECGLAAYNATQMMIKKFNLTLTPLQSSLVSTVYQWFANRSSISAGEQAFQSSIANISKIYSTESDIRALWGLSLLNVAYERQFEGELEPKPMLESREVLKQALQMEPGHPGALHYLIHAYDIDQVDIAEKASDYAVLYNDTVRTLSHAQHMPAHIWMRTGGWLLAASADASAIQVSMSLCATKLLNRHVSISSVELDHALTHFNDTIQLVTFLQCDAENRAHSTEWLSYSRLQTGDWSGSVARLRDLVNADKQSVLTPNHYLPFAYRAQARTIVELFFWFPYSNQFLTKIQPLLIFNEAQTGVPFGDNADGWYPIWSEAGYRFAECLQILTNFHMNNNTINSLSTIDDHLARFPILADRSSKLSKYISKSIKMMIPQVLGMRHYINESWQDCLNELNNATELEASLITGGNSPTLIFARSNELLAMHLLLMYEKYQNSLVGRNSSTYMLNGTQVSIDQFPSIALELYTSADHVAPNRAINTLGMARSNAFLEQHNIAVSLYQQLYFQMTSSNRSDETFLREADDYLDKHNSAIHCHFSYILIILSIFFCFYQ